MANKITIDFLRRRLAHVIAPAMGWIVEGDYKTVGRVYIEKAAVGANYRLVQIVGKTGGERNLSDTLSKRELLAFMDGLLFAAEKFSGKDGI